LYNHPFFFHTHPFFFLQGSHLLANTLFAVLIWSLYMQFPVLAACAKVLTPTGHSLTGAALGLLLVLRTNSLLYCFTALLYSALLCFTLLSGVPDELGVRARV
jgi:hypothetical protein